MKCKAFAGLLASLPAVCLVLSSLPAQAADTQAPVIQSVIPFKGATVAVLTNITVVFSEPVTGIDAESLQINGEPALGILGSLGTFTFRFTQPAPGPVQISWDVDQGITDLAGNPFNDSDSSATWPYTVVDTVAPSVLRRTPEASATVTTFGQVEVWFSETVTGVDAGDLTVDGQGAVGVSGTGAGPYVFDFVPPEAGLLQIAWAQGHGIQDMALAPNALAEGPWTVHLDPAASVSVQINEILAENLTGLVDENVQKEDWIELRNTGTGPVSLLGWSLSDDPADPGKWVFPDKTLAAGGYLLVFASGKNRASSAPAAINHTSFRLNVNGGFLGLFTATYPRQAASVFAPEHPELRGDISYGRTGSNTLAWFSTVTPGAANADGTALSGIVAPPHASVPGGFFDHAVDLALSCATPGARIHYTLNGSAPTLQSAEYYGPLRLQGLPGKGAVILRAAAFVPGQLPSLTTTRTYLFPEFVLTQPANPEGFPAIWDSPCTFPAGSPLNCSDISGDYEMDRQVLTNAAQNYGALARTGLTAIPSISIVTDPSLLFGASQGVYVRREPFNQQPIHVEFLSPDGSEPGFELSCGLEIVGGTSPDDQGADWKSKKLSMRLMFKGEFGPVKLNYRVFADSPADSFDTLILDAGLNYVWSYNGGSSPDDQRLRAQYVRDQYMSDLQNAMGGAAPHGRYVHLYLNGLYWGLYDLHERPDHAFAAQYLGGEKEQYDVLKHRVSTVVNGSAASYNTLLDAARAGLTNNAVYENLQLHLDLPGFVDYMMLNLWAGNTDWAHQNWYASRKQSQDGRWRYHSWDAEHVMKSATENVLSRNDANGPTELFQRLRDNPEFRLLFADRVHRQFFNGGVFHVDPANPMYNPAFPQRNRPAALWMRRISEIDPGPIVAESARWGDSGATGTSRANNPLTRNVEFVDELDALMGRRNPSGHGSSYNYFPQRSSNVLSQFRAGGLYPNVEAPKFSQHGGRVALGFPLAITAPAGAIYYTTNGNDPRLYGSGAVSPEARLYAPGNPIALGATTTVRARVLSGGTWSALNEALFLVEELTVPIRVTEIMYNPAGSGVYEFLELRNVGGAALPLGGCEFGGISFTFPNGAVLAPGETIILANNGNPVAFAQRYPGVVVLDYFGGSLDNAGETITLRTSTGTTLFSVTYDDENGWPLEADGLGPSLEIIDVHGAGSDPANWRASQALFGTPGLIPAAPPEEEIQLHELMAENLGAVDHEGTFPDFVELHNSGLAEVDLAGYSLTDGTDTGRFVFPPETLIASGGWLVVWLDASTNATSGHHANFELSHTRGGLFLYNAANARIDAVTFGLVPGDYSLGRIGGSWVLNTPTPSAVNEAVVLASASSVGINEWMANPVPQSDDWLELHNRSAVAPVALRGMHLGAGDALFQIRDHVFLPPLGYLQLFAEERTGPDQLDLRLSGSGGVLVLYDSSGLELERVTYPAQVSGVSSGRLPDGSLAGIVDFPGSPSPAAANHKVSYTGPILSEVLARNQAAAVSPWGTFADFVELRNTNGTSLDLSGMTLGFEPSGPALFAFQPGTMLPSGEHLVIWFDGDRPVANAPGGPYNVAEDLRGHGGGVYLFTASGQAAASITFGPQIIDHSIGLDNGSWQLLGVPTPGQPNGTPAVLGPASAIRVNEWMANPISGDDWFELYNAGVNPVRLEGMFVTDNPSLNGQIQFAIGPLSYIGAGHFLRWEADGSPGQGPNHVNFALDASGETIALYQSDGTLVDAVSFGLQRLGASQGRLPDGQDAIVEFASTPTPEENNYLPLTQVVLNEVLSHTDPPLEDAIELRNLSATELDLGGWFLSDNQGQFKKFRIPEGTMLPGHGYWTFYENQINGGEGSLVPFTLDSVRGDEVWLSEASETGQLTGARARARFGAAANGVSFGRYPTSVGVDFPPQSGTSFGRDDAVSVEDFRLGTGLANPGPRVGPVVINEIRSETSAASGAEEPSLVEFIELHNPGSMPVVLYDANHPSNTWRLDNAVGFEFPEAAVLPAKGYAVVTSFDPDLDPEALAAFQAHYGLPQEVPIYGPYQGRLAKDGERVELLRPDVPQTGAEAGYVPYVLVDQVAYGNRFPWPAISEATPSSLQRRRPWDYGNDPAHWKAQMPTPGRANVLGAGFADDDQDGIPDDYETSHGMSGGDAGDALLDGDHDGRTNYQEFLEETQPESALSVLVAPTIGVQPQDQSTTPGNTVSLSVSVTGSSPRWHQWYRNGLPLEQATNSAITLSPVAVADHGRYHVAVWNAGGFALSDLALVQVVVPPRITQHPGSLTLSNGLTAVFSVQAVGTGLLRYQWKLFGTNLPNANASTLILANIQLEQAGPYTVQVTDDLASVTSDAATLKVLERITVVSPPGPPRIALEGSTASFTVMARGTLPISYRWRVGFSIRKVEILQSNVSVFVLTNLALTDSNRVISCLLSNEVDFRPGVAWTNSLLIVLPDTDRDGMDNGYEIAHGFIPTDATDASLDSDMDDMSNLEEYIAGTDPGDGDSFLQVGIAHAVPGPAGRVQIQFQALAGKSYSVLYRETVTSSDWVKLFDVDAEAQGRFMQLSDPGSLGAPRRIYRLVTPKRLE